MERVMMMDCGDAVRRADNGCFGKFPTAKVASFTIAAIDAGKAYSNAGSAVNIVATLPTAKAGMWFAFMRPTVGFTFKILAVTPAKIDGGVAAGAIYVPPGQAVEVFSDGTDWYTRLGGGGSVVLTLTNVQIKALRATPVEIIPAPGAAKMIEFAGGSVILKAGANVLSESAANLALKYTNGSGVALCTTVECTGFIDQAVDTATTITPKLDGIVAVSAAANAAVVLHNTGAGEFAGNAAADATLIVCVSYRIRPTA